MNQERFFKDHRLPFAEGRYSQNSRRSFKPHIHLSFGIGAVDQGNVFYQVEGGSVHLKPGALTLINPETLHSCNPQTTDARSYYMLYLQTDWCLKVQRSLWHTDTFRPVDTVLLQDESYYRLFVDTMGCLLGDTLLMEKEQALVRLVESVFKSCCHSGPAAADVPRHIEHLKAQLNDHLEEDLTLEQMASELGANPSYTLLRQFKNATGITPHAYRMNCRIDLARTILQRGEDIGDTALICGFFDQSHFHRAFKAMTTVTPREYQLNFLQ